MREIKFRGMSVHELASGNRWLYGNVCIGEYSYIEDMPVDEKTVGQYTGLKDKNCKEIFEGDIVKDCDGNINQVSYDRGMFGCYETYSISFYSDEKVTKLEPLANYLIDGAEIIGNIYENPELLEVTK